MDNMGDNWDTNTDRDMEEEGEGEGEGEPKYLVIFEKASVAQPCTSR